MQSFSNWDKVLCSSAVRFKVQDARSSLLRRCSSACVGGSTPLRGPFCSADPVVGVVVQRKGEQKEPRQLSEANTDRDIRLSSEAIPSLTCHFYRVEKRTLAAQAAAGAAAAAAAAATCSALLQPVDETHQRGRLSWHELTYQVKHGNQTFLVIG